MKLLAGSSESLFRSQNLSKSTTEYNNFDDLDIINELKSKINKLKTDVQSCEHELENTILENNELRRQVDKLSNELSILKDICTSPHGTIRNRMNTIISPSPDNLSSNLNQSRKIIELEQTIKELQQEVQIAQEEIRNLNTTIKDLEQELQTVNTSPPEMDLITEDRKKELKYNE